MLSTIDPRELTHEELKDEIATAVRGAISSEHVEARIKARFSPHPQIVVQEKGPDFFGVAIGWHGLPKTSFICPR